MTEFFCACFFQKNQVLKNVSKTFKSIWRPNVWMDSREKIILLYQFLLYLLLYKSFSPWMACFNKNVNDLNFSPKSTDPQINLKILTLIKFNESSFFVKRQSAGLTFCQIIIGSPLNNTLLLNEGIPRALKGKKLRLKIPRVLPSIFEFILVIQIWG